MTTTNYDKLAEGAIDDIDAAVWSGDIFHNRANVAAFRDMMARWEKGLKISEDVLIDISDSE
jgi:hypothetical protein